MIVELHEVQRDEKEILMNLLEKYQYEFSQWERADVNPDGNYGYKYLYCYFEEENRHPYFIKVDGRLAGFVMISDYPEVPEEPTDYCLSEFFVMYKYRRCGVGRQAANMVLDKHHGRWQLKRHPHNIGSVRFWDSVISEYTRGTTGSFPPTPITRLTTMTVPRRTYSSLKIKLRGVKPMFTFGVRPQM